VWSTVIEYRREFCKQVKFSQSKYCAIVVFRPMSTTMTRNRMEPLNCCWWHNLWNTPTVRLCAVALLLPVGVTVGMTA